MHAQASSTQHNPTALPAGHWIFLPPFVCYGIFFSGHRGVDFSTATQKLLMHSKKKKKKMPSSGITDIGCFVTFSCLPWWPFSTLWQKKQQPLFHQIWEACDHLTQTLALYPMISRRHPGGEFFLADGTHPSVVIYWVSTPSVAFPSVGCITMIQLLPLPLIERVFKWELCKVLNI